MIQEEFLDYACPIIRDILNDMEIYDVSSSEVDDIGRDLLLEIDLDNFNEETFYSLLGDYLETYDIEKENKQDDYDLD